MSISDDLEKLGDLRQRGHLTDDEFARAKARVLGEATRPGADRAFGVVNGLRRDREDRWLGGVCGGIARSTGLAAWIWRLMFVLTAVCAGTGVLVYLLLWVVLPEDPFARGGHDSVRAG